MIIYRAQNWFLILLNYFDINNIRYKLYLLCYKLYFPNYHFQEIFFSIVKKLKSIAL